MNKVKSFFLVLPMLVITSALQASSLTLIYPMNSELKPAEALIGARVNTRLFAIAETALTAGPTVYVSTNGDDLRMAYLLKFDLDLNIAEFKIGEVVDNSVLQQMHRDNSKAYARFLSTGIVSTDMVQKAISVESNDFIFDIKIGGHKVDDQEVLLPVSRKTSECELQIVYQSTTPTKGWTVELESLPKVPFWRKQRSQDRSDVPRTNFRYDHTTLFKPYEKGETVTIPLEIYKIDQDFYIWTLKISSQKKKFKKQIKVRFK